MKIISAGAELSQIYTNHSVRTCATTLLSDANIPDRHIMFVSGHSSEQSLAHYNSRPSETQLESVSDTISNEVENNQPQSTEISSITKAPAEWPPTSPCRRQPQTFPAAFLTLAIFKETYRSFSARRAAPMTKIELHFQYFVLDLYVLQFNFSFLSDFLFQGKLHLIQV